MGVLINMVGQRIGKLVVLKRCTDKEQLSRFSRYCHTVIWECQCDCGRKAYVPREELVKSIKKERLTGHVKSCGCVRSPDETGKRYGRLVVVKRLTSGPDYERIKAYKSSVIWQCQCDCGEISVKAASDLRRKPSHHPSVSCGCLQQDMASINLCGLDTPPIVHLEDHFVREKMAKRGFRCKPRVMSL